MRKYRASYFLSQSFKGMWRHATMTLASITVLLLSLTVIGCFLMLVVNINVNLESIGELNEIVAFANTHEEYAAGKDATLAPELKAEGKTFLGWAIDPDAVTPDYPAGSKYTVAPEDAVGGTVTMYAIWKERPTDNGYKIVYSASGKKLDGALPKDEAVYADKQSTVLATALSSRFGSAQFLGWARTPDAKEPDFKAGEGYAVNAADARAGIITLYAVWDKPEEINSYSIVYDANRTEVDKLPADSDVRRELIMSELKKLDNIKPDGITFVSREEALEEELKNFAEYPSVLAVLQNGDNPYNDSFEIIYEDNASVDLLELNLQKIEGIYRTSCRADIANNIESLKNSIVTVFSWFMVILFIVSVIIIINTVKLAVSGRTKEIAVMRYVGATRWFIAFPFQLEGIIIGLFSGGLSFLLQWLLYSYAQNSLVSQIQMIKVVPFAEISGVLLVGSLIIGAVTGVLGSAISIGKNLKA